MGRVLYFSEAGLVDLKVAYLGIEDKKIALLLVLEPMPTPSELDLTTYPSKSPQLSSEGKDSLHVTLLVRTDKSSGVSN